MKKAKPVKAEERLASYGTLAPGEENHHQLAGLTGTWREGTVRGRRLKSDRGTWQGYPAFVLDPNGDAIKVHIFESADLPDHWPHLDAFEGDHYQRTVAKAETDTGPLDVSIYIFKGSPDQGI